MQNFFLRTLRLTDAAAVKPGFEPQRDRGVRGSRFVGAVGGSFLTPLHPSLFGLCGWFIAGNWVKRKVIFCWCGFGDLKRQREDEVPQPVG